MAPDNLQAPWRIDYIRKLDQPADVSPASGSTGCFLCDAAKPDNTPEDDARQYVLLRDERGVLMLNRYPYTNGHLLAAPLQHIAELDAMTPAQRAGLMELANLGCQALRATSNPQGFNIGMNLGRCAGAGVPGHAHLHIVPRWAGDANFMQAVGGVRVIPQSLEDSYAQLKEALAGLP